MAYLPTQTDEDRQKQQEQAGGGTGSASVPVVSAGGGVEAPATPMVNSGSFPAITAYLKNAGQQAGQLAADAKTNIGNQTAAAQGDIAGQGEAWKANNQGAYDAWSKDQDSAYQTYLDEQRKAQSRYVVGNLEADIKKIDDAIGGPERDRYGIGLFDNLSDDRRALNRYKADNTPKYMDRYVAEEAADFAPTRAKPTLTVWTPDTSKVSAAQADLTALGTDAGRAAYLANQAGTGYYTPGMRNLDASLLGVGLNTQDMAQYGAVLDALRSSPAPAIDLQEKTYKKYGSK